LAGDPARARHWFECALPLAAQSENAIVLATLAKNLGSLHALAGDHATATQYFDGLAQIAPKMLDNETLSWALEQRGASEAALGRNTARGPGLRAHLPQLRDLPEARGGLAECARVERELERLPEAAPHG